MSKRAEGEEDGSRRPITIAQLDVTGNVLEHSAGRLIAHWQGSVSVCRAWSPTCHGC